MRLRYIQFCERLRACEDADFCERDIRRGDVMAMNMPERERQLEYQRGQREIDSAAPGEGPQQKSVGLGQLRSPFLQIISESSVIG